MTDHPWWRTIWCSDNLTAACSWCILLGQQAITSSERKNLNEMNSIAQMLHKQDPNLFNWNTIFIKNGVELSKHMAPTYLPSSLSFWIEQGMNQMVCLPCFFPEGGAQGQKSYGNEQTGVYLSRLDCSPRPGPVLPSCLVGWGWYHQTRP